jgi:predicted ArsR family transcriptional regulator
VTDAVRAVAALDDPQRARLYRVVRDAHAPITREDAAASVGISRKLAAFHLDRLVDAGLLEVSFERPAGVGARIGRAPKRYRASNVDVQVSIPERRYDIVGEILLNALERTGAGESPAEAAARAAYERGRDLGAATQAARKLGRLGPERARSVVVELLAQHGFEPAPRDDRIVQRNCPFHQLAQRSPALVCGINRHFVDGLLDGLDAARLCADLEPADDRCCVVISTR